MRARALLALALLGVARAAAADPEPAPASAPAEAPAPAPAEAPAAAEPADPCDPAPEAAEIARRAERVLRGDGSELEATLSIAREGRAPRTLPFRVWDDALGDRVLVRVVGPAAVAGSAWLKLPPVLWSFDPKAGETRRVARPHWADPWLGSELSLEDVVRGTGARDAAHELLRVEAGAGPEGPARVWVVESTPREPADAAWARLVDWVECRRAALLRRDYYDAKGALVRTLALEDWREVAGRPYPHLWVMKAAADPARESRIRVDGVRFTAELPAGTFSTRSLHPGS